MKHSHQLNKPNYLQPHMCAHLMFRVAVPVAAVRVRARDALKTACCSGERAIGQAFFKTPQARYLDLRGNNIQALA